MNHEGSASNRVGSSSIVPSAFLRLLLAWVVDLLVIGIVYRFGYDLAISHVSGFIAGLAIASPFSSLYGIGGSTAPGGLACRLRRVDVLVVCMLALFFRGGILGLLAQRCGVPVLPAAAAAILVGATAIRLGCLLLAHSASSDPVRGRWPLMIVLPIVVYAVLLRLCYLGQLELLPEEAYYWNYAQHIDIGYLDHPPMVGWLIWLSTAAAGHNEFAVRLGAFCCWLIAAAFGYRLARNLFDTATAAVLLMLMAVLPFFFGIGVFMSPDAPVVACWAAVLHFLERALIGGKRLAWWGAGISLGLGLLSKYTIILLVPAAAVLVLADRRHRRWLMRPEPYAALLVALALFSPVILWNARHGWASFAFQGPERLANGGRFSLHLLVWLAALVVTPIGLATAFRLTLPWKKRDQPACSQCSPVRAFSLVFLLVPLAVFAVHSIVCRPKLNWTGPAWLAIVPALAWSLRHRWFAERLWVRVLRLWKPMVAGLLVLYAAGLHYVALGLPFVGYPQGSTFIGSRDLGIQIEQIDAAFRRETGADLLLVSLDKYGIASETAFYRASADRRPGVLHSDDALNNTAGRNILNAGRSLMYEFWGDARRSAGRTVLLLDDDADELRSELVRKHFASLGDVRRIIVRTNGKVAGQYYYRIGYGYRPGPGA